MDITELFCNSDDFCKEFMVSYFQAQLPESKIHRNRPTGLSLSEMLTILIKFHHSAGYRNFKGYYCQQVLKELKPYFPGAVSYSRFVHLLPRVFVPLCGYLSTRRGRETGIYFVDSTKLSVCDNHRIHSHKVFQGIAQRGKTSMGWFYGLKLHLITNECGELISLRITPGNVDDREPLPEMAKGLKGSMFGDKGYISQELFEKLQAHFLRFVTKSRKNMKQRGAYLPG